MERLGLVDAADYAEWCRTRGFRTSLQKSWSELEGEWCAHGRDLAVARSRCRVDRDPARLIARVCAGTAASVDIARPRWRALAERVERAGLAGRERDALRVLVERVGSRGSLLLAEGTFGDARHRFVDGLVALARRHRAWHCDPRTWRARSHDARRQFASLARHLLAHYPVPAFLDAAWLRGDAHAERYRDWWLCVASGGNVRHAAAPIRLTRRIVHHFLRAPAHYAIEGALRWGQIHALGGDRALVEAVLGTRLGARFENEAFWEGVLRWLVAHPQIEPAQVGPLVDYLHEQRFAARDVFVARGVRERLPPAQPNLSMRGRSPEALLREVERWHRALARSGPGARVRWEPSGIGALELETGVRGRSLRVWRIRELLCGAELRREGAVLRHCVAAYAAECAARRCSIWTLELWSFDGVEKRLTIEVRDGVVVQCRGRFNRAPTAQERGLVARWAEAQDLRMGRWV